VAREWSLVSSMPCTRHRWCSAASASRPHARVHRATPWMRRAALCPPEKAPTPCAPAAAAKDAGWAHALQGTGLTGLGHTGAALNPWSACSTSRSASKSSISLVMATLASRLSCKPKLRTLRRTCTSRVRRVPAQTWAGLSPIPVADVGGVSAVRVQMRPAGASPVPCQSWRRRGGSPGAGVSAATPTCSMRAGEPASPGGARSSDGAQTTPRFAASIREAGACRLTCRCGVGVSPSPGGRCVQG
jgi:hypothetical protein